MVRQNFHWPSARRLTIQRFFKLTFSTPPPDSYVSGAAEEAGVGNTVGHSKGASTAYYDVVQYSRISDSNVSGDPTDATTSFSLFAQLEPTSSAGICTGHCGAACSMRLSPEQSRLGARGFRSPYQRVGL